MKEVMHDATKLLSSTRNDMIQRLDKRYGTTVAIRELQSCLDQASNSYSEVLVSTDMQTYRMHAQYL